MAQDIGFILAKIGEVLKNNNFRNLNKFTFLFFILAIGAVFGWIQGWSTRGETGAMPATIAGMFGSISGVITCAVFVRLTNRSLDAGWLLNGAMAGTLGSGVGRIDLSLLAGIMGGVLVGIISFLDQRKGSAPRPKRRREGTQPLRNRDSESDGL